MKDLSAYTSLTKLDLDCILKKATLTFIYFTYHPASACALANPQNFYCQAQSIHLYFLLYYSWSCHVSDNSFREITGLEQCCKLTHLSLANNKISRISGLDSLPLTHLCLVGASLTHRGLYCTCSTCMYMFVFCFFYYRNGILFFMASFSGGSTPLELYFLVVCVVLYVHPNLPGPVHLSFLPPLSFFMSVFWLRFHIQ